MDELPGFEHVLADAIKSRADGLVPEIWETVRVFEIESSYVVHIQRSQALGKWAVKVTDQDGNLVDVSNPEPTPQMAVLATKWQKLDLN